MDIFTTEPFMVLVNAAGRFVRSNPLHRSLADTYFIIEQV